MQKLTNCIIIINDIKIIAVSQKECYMKKGFSLIELMVSVAILAILTSVVSIVYPSYTARSQVTSAVMLLESYIKQAQRLYAERNMGNTGFTGMDIDTLGGYTAGSGSADIISSITVSSATVSNLTLAATFNNKASSSLSAKTINLTVTVDNGGTFSITCSVPGVAADYLPSNCR